jgi:hypothetical protein
MRRALNTICLFFFFVLIASVSGCASIQSEPEVEATLVVASTSTPRPSLTISPSKTPTLTSTITPTVTPTATPNPYRNWGKFPLHLDVPHWEMEKNAIIIPYNPVDNKEEFEEFVLKLEEIKGGPGSLGLIEVDRAGVDPVNKILHQQGYLINAFQVFVFEYEGDFFPVIYVHQNGRDEWSSFALMNPDSYERRISKANKGKRKINGKVYQNYVVVSLDKEYPVDLIDESVRSGRFSEAFGELLKNTDYSFSNFCLTRPEYGGCDN